MKQLAFSLLAVMICGSGAFADNAMTVKTTVGSPREVTITALTPDIIRVTNVPSGVAPAESRTLVAPADSDVDAAISSNKYASTLVTESNVTVTVSRANGAVVITSPDGTVIADGGVRGSVDGKQTLTLTTPGNESFYGAGERGYSLDLSCDTLVMFNKQNYGYTAGESRIKQMNITMPLVLSSRGYAILFDDYAAASLTTHNPLTYTTESNVPVTWYFVNGVAVEGDEPQACMSNVVENLTSLTGRQPLPPLWSLGYITSKYGYHDEAETRAVVERLKKEGYPLDGIVLDLYWYGKEEDMGRLEWDPVQWPTPKKMLSDFKKKGVNLVAISQPYVLRNGRAIDNYNELAPKGYFVKDSLGNPGSVTIWVGQGGMFDVSNPDTRAWLSNRYRELTDMGVTGWWGDLGEPEVHPDSLVHHNGLPARLYHNLYGNDWSQIIYDLFAKQYPERRLMTMMRAGTIGLQKFSVFPWSTDVSRSWGGLQPQVTIMLNAGLSGLCYMSHDVGGFAVDPANPVDPELYVRWLQLGVFSPVLRTHATVKAEPYNYPELKDIILPLIKERYAWLPYNYTLAYENNTKGEPMVRPLNYYNPTDRSFDKINDEYLWGRDILVAPVVTQGATEREIVFPQGEWLDITNPSTVYQGGQTITYPAPLEVLPMFVRAGAFIPRADYKMNNVGDYRTDNYTIRYYPTVGKSGGHLYEDNLTSPRAIEDKDYAVYAMEGVSTDTTIDITLSKEVVTNRPDEAKKLTFEVYNVDSKPASVTFGGRKVSYKYDETKRVLSFKVNWNTSTPGSIVITR